MKYSPSIACNCAHFADFLSSLRALHRAVLPCRIFPFCLLLAASTPLQIHWDDQQVCRVVFFLINFYSSWTALTKGSWKSEYFFHTVHYYNLIETFSRKTLLFHSSRDPLYLVMRENKVFSTMCATPFQSVTKWRPEKKSSVKSPDPLQTHWFLFLCSNFLELLPKGFLTRFLQWWESKNCQQKQKGETGSTI